MAYICPQSSFPLQRASLVPFSRISVKEQGSALLGLLAGCSIWVQENPTLCGCTAVLFAVINEFNCSA